MNNNIFNVNDYSILNDTSNILIDSTNSTETNLKNIQSNADKLFSEEIFSGPIADEIKPNWENSVTNLNNSIADLSKAGAGLKNISENYQLTDTSNSESIAGL